jgi:DNA (cytosine-5)-methyltransferase 3A
MKKILIGGSPCTFWSIAQKNDRETEAEGLGWELFDNYNIAKKKFKPDFFLYENNKSAAQPIKDQISRELGVVLMYINSALVSAQNRERFYCFNWTVDQPEDRGLVLRDILEDGVCGTSYSLAPPKSSTVCVNSKSGRGGVDGLQPSLSNRIYSVDGKNPAVTASYMTKIAEPVRVGTIESEAKNKAHDSKQYRVYSPDGKATTLCGNGGGVGAKTGLYACPAKIGDEGLYKVIGGKTEIDGKEYPINLQDGLYVVRKPTVKECCRLQTLPDDYCRAVSPNQAYKGLGNGWTAEVIIHILNGALKDVPRDEEIVVLSMYDGIGTGRYCLDKMGFKNVKYFAYEIDKYAKRVAMSNYPDIIQMGDAFDLRNPDWTIGY